ncbi:RWP-RK domain [Phytophthora cinnamomi]|uniref:RWP-RK domain n=1 Tax=Phytophthora cinnamomi TaxID=4785 RepID=UPI00355A556D|nr:RWP-RK domain [Phytophthora cinnamomi]
MSLTRRNVGQGAESSEDRGRRGSTIWEDEADEYWKKMEPAQRCRRITNYLAALVAVVLLGGGVFYGAQTALDVDSIAALKARFSSPQVSTPQNLTNVAEPAPASVSMPMPTAPAVPVQTSESLGQEAQRGRCRVRGVQSRWHEETCRKLCVRDPHNAACMNGCSYGSLTVTKLVCDKMQPADVPAAARCPDGVSCMEACRAYDDEKPFPDLRNSCVRGCSNIVPSACARALQVYRDLLAEAQ